MPTLTLTPRELAALERLARSTRDAAQLRRVAALLALADGQPATAVARAQRVGRSALYEWIGRFEAYRRRDLRAATTNRTAPGRDRDLRVVHLFRFAPHVMERRLDIGLEHPLDLGRDRGAHQVERVDREERIPHIGFVSPVEMPRYFLAFRQGLRELGYIEGQSLFI